MLAGWHSCPNTNAISCRKRADRSCNPSAKANTAGTAVGRSGGEERSRNANMARYLWKSGSPVSSSVCLSSGMECSFAVKGVGGAGSMDVKSLLSLLIWHALIRCLESKISPFLHFLCLPLAGCLPQYSFQSNITSLSNNFFLIFVILQFP